MSISLSPVTFHGDTIFCTTFQNQPYTAMKPIIENMGLAWQAQARKLTASKERWGITIMMIPSSGGEQETLCMPVRKLPAFLNTINPKKVRPELRERIELYQNESDDVLWNYWTNQQKKDDRLSTVEDRRALNTIVHTWAQASRQKYSMCWKQVNCAFNLEKAAQFPARWIPDAVAWVQAKIDALEAPAPELPARAPKPLPAPKLPAIALDLTRTDAISFDELSDALRSIVMRLERACCSMPPREYTKGCKAFSRIAEGDTSLDCVIQALIVGPRYATLDLLKTALTMAEKAQRTHALVCEAGRG